MDNLKEIKVSELKSTFIDNKDMDNVKDLAKALKIKYKIFTIILLYITFIMGAISIPNLIKLIKFGITLNVDTIGSVIFAGLFIFFNYLLYDIIQDMKFLKTYNPQKSQYGVVKEKYIISERNEESTSTSYYIDVLFKEDNTFIKEVETAPRIYSNLKNGDKILVVSFNGKKTYCFKVNSI